MPVYTSLRDRDENHQESTGIMMTFTQDPLQYLTHYDAYSEV
jgi:hypothetical protein